MVDDNAEAECSLTTDTRFLQLIKSKATALTNLRVVPYGLATHSRAEESEWANTKRGRLGFARVTPAELAAGLVEPCLHATLPVFAKVISVKDVVFPETHGFLKSEGHEEVVNDGCVENAREIDDNRCIHRICTPSSG